MSDAAPMDNRLRGRRLVDAFEACSLAPGSFGHVEHVEVAWHYLRAYGADDAFARFASGLQRLAAHFGAPGKYDESITRAFIELIDARMKREPLGDREGDGPRDENDTPETTLELWDRFAADNADLLRWPNDLVRSAD